ncbi:MAG: efflux RND transporter periplasmic adaptor subunit [Woeseiaceae bacterium]|nr:efflux RND transporter periplasmic adaptor subunit [Woeseiaceae bacterium]
MKTQHGIAVLALLLPGILTGCGVGEASVAEASDATLPIPVEVTRPERTDLYATYESTATIETDNVANALARVPGQVVDIVVEEGQFVAAGDVLAVLDGERLRLEMLAAKADLDQARDEYARHQAMHARGLISASMYEGMKYDVEALKAVYKLAALNYDYSSIRAPISGVVTSRDIKAGQTLATNQLAFQIADTSELVAYLQIPQGELGKFDMGDKAMLSVDALPDVPFYSVVRRISPTIDTRSGTFRATVVIDNTIGLLAPGMFGRFTVAYEKHDGALTIPEQAIVEEDDERYVFVVKNNEVERRSVRVGIKYMNDVEILEGLAADEQVVVVGHSSLRDGARVLAQTPASDRFTG